MGVWKNVNVVWFFADSKSERVDDFNIFQCIEPKFKTIGKFTIGWEKIYGVANYAEVAALKR